MSNLPPGVISTLTRGPCPHMDVTSDEFAARTPAMNRRDSVKHAFFGAEFYSLRQCWVPLMASETIPVCNSWPNACLLEAED